MDKEGADGVSLLGTDFIRHFEAYCPQTLAEEGDPVGLHVGTLKKNINKVMITLDVRPETVAEAIAKKVDLIIAKHPPIFRPIKRLLTDDPQTKMYQNLLTHQIAVYAAHTNLDIIENGLNDWFCDVLGIENTTYIQETHEIPYLKLSVYVPTAEAETVRQGLYHAGAGQLSSNYHDCSFSSTGEGHFTPIGKARPVIGRLSEPEVVAETKIDVTLLETAKDEVLRALKASHPYEEPAYDLVKLVNQGKKYGLGRVGNLAEPIKLTDLIQLVKTKFNLEGLRLVSNNPDQLVQRIAICGGSGEKFFRAALKHDADVYITGDVYYHTAHDMLAEGLSVIDPGHHIEVLCQSKLLEICQQWNSEQAWDITFIQSEADTNPFRFY